MVIMNLMQEKIDYLFKEKQIEINEHSKPENK